MKVIITRMHSSRMRIARSLTVSPRMLCSGAGAWSGGVPGPGGGAWFQGGLVRGVPGPGGCLVLGVCAWSRGGVPGRRVWYPSIH